MPRRVDAQKEAVILEQLIAGVDPLDIATAVGVARSTVYAVRKRAGLGSDDMPADRDSLQTVLEQLLIAHRTIGRLERDLERERQRNELLQERLDRIGRRDD